MRVEIAGYQGGGAGESTPKKSSGSGAEKAKTTPRKRKAGAGEGDEATPRKRGRPKKTSTPVMGEDESEEMENIKGEEPEEGEGSEI